MTQDNNLLGKFHLNGIPSTSRVASQIDVTLAVDTNEILNESAQDESTGKMNRILISNEKGHLSQNTV